MSKQQLVNAGLSFYDAMAGVNAELV